jgi:Uma2 family endonuclease
MSAIPKPKFTIDEYIEFDKNTEGKWEYFDGEVLDMAGGSLNHNRIARNLIALFERELRDKPYEVLPSDMRIKVPKALPYRYADVVIVCEKPIIEEIQGQEMLVNPLLIVEVLSPTTEGYDYGAKFIAYQSIESFREYLLVSQERPHVTHYVRQPGDQWLRNDIEGMEKTLSLATVVCKLGLGEIYRLVMFSP